MLIYVLEIRPGSSADAQYMNDQPKVNTEPSTENKHITDGSGVRVPDSVPTTGMHPETASGVSDAKSSTVEGEHDAAKGEKKDKGGKAHRFMEKVKDKLHMH